MEFKPSKFPSLNAKEGKCLIIKKERLKIGLELMVKGLKEG